MEPIKFETNIELEDYQKFVQLLAFKKRKYIFIIFAFLTIAGIINIFLTPEGVISKIGFARQLIFVLVFPLYFIFLFIMTKRGATKIYESNKQLKEKIKYEIDSDTINITGETFQSNISWVSMYKFKEMKKWVFIYHDKLSANIIPKKDMQVGDLERLLEIVNSKPDLIKELLKK